MREAVYEVFARKSRGDRLCHVGYVDALDDETARVHAWTTYSEEKWFEMCVVRRNDVIAVKPQRRWSSHGLAMRDETRTALCRLILGLADSKRLLGIRYSDWILGSPSLETGISLASMAQDEWGHARLLYAMLKEVGEEPEELERERSASEYANIGGLDKTMSEWPELVATMVVTDTALTTALAGFADGNFELAASRVPKMLAEEQFHLPLGVAWYRRLARTRSEARDLLARASRHQLRVALAWLGTDDTHRRRVVDAGLTSSRMEQIAAFRVAVGPVLDEAGIDAAKAVAARDWDPTRGRGYGQPEGEAVERARGDRNRLLFVR